MPSYKMVCPFCGAGHTAQHEVAGIPLFVCEKAPRKAVAFVQAEPVRRCSIVHGAYGPDWKFCQLQAGHIGPCVEGWSYRQRIQMEQETVSPSGFEEDSAQRRRGCRMMPLASCPCGAYCTEKKDLKRFQLRHGANCEKLRRQALSKKLAQGTKCIDEVEGEPLWPELFPGKA